MVYKVHRWTKIARLQEAQTSIKVHRPQHGTDSCVHSEGHKTFREFQLSGMHSDGEPRRKSEMAFALDFEKPGYKQSGLGRTDSREQKWQDSGKGARGPGSI